MPRFWNYLIHLKNTLTISIYRVIVYVQIEAYRSTNVKLFVLVAVVMGDISTWSSVTLVSRSPFLSKILYSFHLFNISKTIHCQLLYQIFPNQSHLLDLIWQRNVWLCGFCMWRWHESKHYTGDLNCSVVKQVHNRKIGTCWVIWMI